MGGFATRLAEDVIPPMYSTIRLPYNRSEIRMRRSGISTRPNDQRATYFAHLNVMVDMDPIRSDPRFASSFKESGSLHDCDGLLCVWTACDCGPGSPLR